MASDVLGSRCVGGQDMPFNDTNSESEGSESHSSEGSSDLEDNGSDNEPLSAGKMSY